MSVFSRSLWPDSVKRPYVRLGIGLLLAPALIASLLTGLAFLLAGTAEKDAAAVATVTTDAAVAFFILVYGFAMTFGLAGILGLWALMQRGLLAWTVCGIVVGGGAGLLFSTLFIGDISRPILFVFMLGGGLLMILVRALAGVQEETA